VPDALEVDVFCDAYGKTAARFELLPPGVSRRRGPEHPLWEVQKHRIYLWNFERSGDSAITREEYERLRSALESRDWSRLL
jgi:hypothetical protein